MPPLYAGVFFFKQKSKYQITNIQITLINILS
jgi:hypothetical protein